MADLVIYLPNHGYSDDDPVYVSWLDYYGYVTDEQTNSFKIDDGAGDILQHVSTITDGYILQYDDTGDVTTITGLTHLIAEDVSVTGSGALIGDYTVSAGGEIALTSTVYDYVVGIPYEATLQPMKIDLSGLGLGVTKKLARVVVSLAGTVGGKIGPDTGNMDNFVFRKVDEAGDEFPYFTGDIEVKLPGGYSRQGDIVVRQSDPRPMTVVALTIDIGGNND